MKKTVPELAARFLKGRTGLSEVEKRVLQSAIDRDPISRDLSAVTTADQGFGDRIADQIARVGGSWTFILSFIAFLVVWTFGNTIILRNGQFDPYPFIFLNLVLSMVAALQAPVIMMSQNRQAQRDRIDASHDYEVNLKAEIEIMALHEKFDELRHQEILAMRDQLAELTALAKALDLRLGNAEKPA